MFLCLKIGWRQAATPATRHADLEQIIPQFPLLPLTSMVRVAIPDAMFSSLSVLFSGGRADILSLQNIPWACVRNTRSQNPLT